MKRIPLYKFYKHKYGDELLVDIVSYETMWQTIHRTPIFTESFYSLTLVEEGDEIIEINGQSFAVTQGTIIATKPGDIWNFKGTMSMRALNLVFEKEYLLSFFRNQHFLDEFPFISGNSTIHFLRLDEALFERVRALYQEMRKEINDYTVVNQHILRAMLYETLVLLSRAEVLQYPAIQNGKERIANRYIHQFCELVVAYLASERSPDFYAKQLCISSNYLSKLVKQAFGMSAKSYIQNQVIKEACQQLCYTTLSVQEISEMLGYDYSSYFVRSFKKHVGVTPLVYRQQFSEKKSPEK